LASSSVEQTLSLGARIGAFLRRGDVVALFGGLGSGKTILAKGIAIGLGVGEVVTSPTYTIVSEYAGSLPVYHIDAYRLQGLDDFLALGGDEYLHGSGVCLVEWSERIVDALPPNAFRIEIQQDGPESRRFLIAAPELENALS